MLLMASALVTNGQTSLTLQQALESGLTNYGSIKAKTLQAQSAEESISQTRRDYVPNVVLGAQQVYGTVNGQNGPLYSFGGFAVGSSGLPLPEQNWNAAFGALYLANINWEVFSFGRANGRVHVAETSSHVAAADLQQELFQHQIRITASYLNVLGTQRIRAAQQKNLDRAQVFQRSVVARAKGGLVAGVDSALANAEVSNAKIALLRAQDFQQEEEKKLAFLIGSTNTDFILDSTFVIQTPTAGEDSVSNAHPVLHFYQSRMNQSQAQLALGRKSYFPTVTLAAVFQGRASGFDSHYAVDQTAFTHSYVEGITPTRMNYLVGFGLVWNLTTILRTSSQTKSLNYQAMAAQADRDLAKQQLATQLQIADTKFNNALLIQKQVPIQVSSATDAYIQKSTLYRNGLTTLVDVTQTLYTLNRAETDRDLAFINVWQALLLKAAASGDLTYFTNELNR